jgi:hypothetical protein
LIHLTLLSIQTTLLGTLSQLTIIEQQSIDYLKYVKY